MPRDPIFYIEFFLLCLMFVIALLAMSRASRMPNGATLVGLCLLVNVAMVEEVIYSGGYSQQYLFIHGALIFWPLVSAALLLLCVGQLTKKDGASAGKTLLYLVPAIVFAVAQWPILSESPAEKTRVFITHDLILDSDHFVLLLSSLTHLLVAVYAQGAMQMLSSYHTHLAEQVAEIERFSLKNLEKFLVVVILASVFAAAIPWIVVAQQWRDVNPFRWQAIIHFLGIMLLAVYLIEVRYFAPAPELSRKGKKKKYSDDEMQQALSAADKAVIRVKAYKKLGVRLPQLAKAAKVEPELLAAALRDKLKINFRVFIFKYRLEYAKKLLLLTNMSVSDVAKSLGFKNQTYLADMFERYMRIKLKEFRNIGREDDLVDWD